MRVGLVAAAIVAAWVSVPANAATIVQTSSNSPSGPVGAVNAFDPAIGTLNSVTLETFANEQRAAGLNFFEPPSASGTYSVSYNLNGEVILTIGRFGGAQTELGRIAIAGTGTQDVTPFAGSQSARLLFSGHGAASFNLDPSLFVSSQPDLVISNNDPGFRNGSLDTVFSSPAAFQAYGIPSSCGEFLIFGDEACNNVGYRLTYDFTPSVPEASTWLMMLVGFAAVGYLARRSPRLSARGSSGSSSAQASAATSGSSL